MNYFLRILHFGIKSRRVYLKWVRRVHAIMTHKRTLIGYWAKWWLITHDYSSWTEQRNISRFVCISLLIETAENSSNILWSTRGSSIRGPHGKPIPHCFKILFKYAIQRGHLQSGSNAVVVTGWGSTRRRRTSLSVSCPCLVFVLIFRKIVSGVCLLSEFSVQFLSVRTLFLLMPVVKAQ